MTKTTDPNTHPARPLLCAHGLTYTRAQVPTCQPCRRAYFLAQRTRTGTR